MAGSKIKGAVAMIIGSYCSHTISGATTVRSPVSAVL